MTAAKKLAALRAKHEAATPGPWERGDRQHIAGVNKRMFGEGRCCYCDRGEPSLVVSKGRRVTHVHEDDQPWWDHGIYAHRPEGSLVVVNDTAEYGYIADTDATAIVSAHNALPALLKALEDVLGIERVPVNRGQVQTYDEGWLDGYNDARREFHAAIEAALAEVQA